MFAWRTANAEFVIGRLAARPAEAARRGHSVRSAIMGRMGTTRCDCKQLSFIALRSYARRHGITDLSDLVRRTGCCTGCGTCRAHLEEFLRTGEFQMGDQRIKIPEPEPPANP